MRQTPTGLVADFRINRAVCLKHRCTPCIRVSGQREQVLAGGTLVFRVMHQELFLVHHLFCWFLLLDMQEGARIDIHNFMFDIRNWYHNKIQERQTGKYEIPMKSKSVLMQLVTERHRYWQ